MDCEFLKGLARDVDGAGGRLMAVGGQVRDRLVPGPAETKNPGGRPDWDLTVFGLELPRILELAEASGPARVVSRRVTTGRYREESLVHLNLDQALVEISPARRPTDRGTEFCPAAAPADDARTRDFTVNAIYFDPLSGAHEDPLGGRADLSARRLRLASPASLEYDPLRMLRAFGLISRLGLSADRELTAETGRLKETLLQAPPDRLWPEWRKWSQSAEPARGLRFLEDSGLLNYWPGLAALPGTPQNQFFHPEGDVWRHTVLVVETISRLDLPPEADRPVLIMAGLLHDIGKPLVTVQQNGIWMSRGHAQAGLEPALDFLTSIRAPERIIRPVLRLVDRHMDLAFTEITPRALRRLARRLDPDCNLSEYWALAVGDWNSRGPSLEPFPLTLGEFLEPLGGQAEMPPPLLLGRDLLANFPQLTPGPELGRLLTEVEEARDEGQLRDKGQALSWVERRLREKGLTAVPADGDPD